MSILKGILHHWNKTSSAYDTIHPETEVAQVTDWNAGIVNTLASTGLSNLVNVLSSDSLLALLIKKVLDATGVKYLTGGNGYLCLGSLFGGVIIQWGKLATKVETVNTVKPNIDCTILLVLPVASYETCARSEPYPWVYATPDGSNMRILVDVDGTRSQDVGLDTVVFWFALGKN